MPSDCLIVGGGVIGLSLAWELAGRGARVRIIEAAAQPASEASWAGAGILPPAGAQAAGALEQLTALSNRLHAEWHDELLRATGIHNGFRRSGGIYLAREPVAAESLRNEVAAWRTAGVECHDVAADSRLGEVEPGLHPSEPLEAAFYLPDECQLRNPRHLKALIAACRLRGVEISCNLPATAFEVHGARLQAVRTAAGPIEAEQFCLTSGAWSAGLLAELGVAPAIRPVRGQMALVRCASPPLARVVNEGLRYLVPRDDGRVLIGSTEENAGFDRSTTPATIAGLVRLGHSLCPALADGQLERSWAGLRPGSSDGRPYLGRIGELENAFLAAGHFRSGLQLSSGTAVVMADTLCGNTPAVDLAPFRLDRTAPQAAKSVAGRA